MGEPIRATRSDCYLLNALEKIERSVGGLGGEVCDVVIDLVLQLDHLREGGSSERKQSRDERVKNEIVGRDSIVHLFNLSTDEINGRMGGSVRAMETSEDGEDGVVTKEKDMKLNRFLVVRVDVEIVIKGIDFLSHKIRHIEYLPKRERMDGRKS